MRISRIALKFGPKIPKISNEKNRMRDLRFLKLISHNGLRRKGIGKFLIVKIDRKIARQPIGISKEPHTVLKINAL